MIHPAHYLTHAARRVFDNLAMGVPTRTAQARTKQTLIDHGLAKFDRDGDLVMTASGRRQFDAWRASLIVPNVDDGRTGEAREAHV